MCHDAGCNCSPNILEVYVKGIQVDKCAQELLQQCQSTISTGLLLLLHTVLELIDFSVESYLVQLKDWPTAKVPS